MTVDGDDVEAESLELLRNRIGRIDLLNGAVYLQIIVVHHDAEVVQLFSGGEHGRLPNLAFLNFAVSQHGINAIVSMIQLAGQRHSYRSGDALSQRTGGHIHPRSALHVRMPLKHGASVAQPLDLLFGEEALQGQRAI